MLSYQDMIDFRNEVLDCKQKLIEIRDTIEIETHWHEIKTIYFPLWKERVKYCTQSAYFLYTEIQEMDNYYYQFST